LPIKESVEQKGAGLEKRGYWNSGSEGRGDWESDLDAVAVAGERGDTDIIDAYFLSKACTLTLSLPDFLFFLVGSSAHPYLLSHLVHPRIPVS